MENVVVFKFIGKNEKRKKFPDFISALRYQGDLLKKKKASLEYAEII